MIVRKFTLCYLILMFGYGQSTGQGNVPEVGKPMPYFTLSHITHYKTSTASLNDFKGKWLFLDFWFTGCTSCIKSFPKINSLQQQFGDKILFMLVGENDNKYNKNIEELFERLREKQNLIISCAFDSILTNLWSINSMPHIIIIDPNGTVKAITSGADLTVDKITRLLDGENVSFSPKASERPNFDRSNTSGSSEHLLFQSLLTKWNGEITKMPVSIARDLKYITNEGLLIAGAPLEILYTYAYLGYYNKDLADTDSLYGKVYPHLVLELQDPSLFHYSFNGGGKGLYNYSLVVPPERAVPEQIMKIMRNELDNIFAFDVSIETREMPVIKLIARNGAKEKLKTRGGRPDFSSKDSSGGAAGFTLRNHSTRTLLGLLMRYVYRELPPYFDEANIDYNIDITVDALMTDLNDIKSALRKNGLDLIESKKEMKVIVIRDKVNNKAY